MAHQNRFSKGLGWGVIDNFSGTGINFIVGILLARALSPEAFSIIGISLLLVTLSNIITDGGISTALIRKPQASATDYNTGFTLNVLTALAVYLLLWCIAPYLADGLSQPTLAPVVRWLGIIVIIAGLSLIPKAQLTRQLNFKTQALASLISSCVGAVTALVLLYNNYGVWAFVVQQIVRQLLYTFVLWSAIRTAPRLQFHPATAKSLFSFGSRLLISGLIDSLFNNVYFYFIGKTFKSHNLGLYSRSEQFSVGLSANFALVLQRVSLPVLSKIQQDPTEFSQRFRILFRYAAMFGLFFSGYLAATSDHFVLLLIGEQWKESVMVVKILCLAALFQPMIVLYQNVLQVYGHSQLYLNLELARKAIAIALLAVSFSLSFEIMLVAMVLIALSSWLLFGIFSTRLLKDFSSWQQTLLMLRYLFPALLLTAAVYHVGQQTSSHLLALFLQTTCYGLGFFILTFCCFNTERQQFLQLVRHRRQ